jgi:multiple sugar transport system substrate-binding protein
MRWFSSGSMRRAWSILGACSLVVALAACGASSNSTGGSGGGNAAKGPQNALVKCPSATTAASPESGNVTLVVASWGADPSELALNQQSFTAFMAKYPNITVQYAPIPSDYDQKMQANVASGNVPDVFYVNQNMAQTYIPAGKLLDLSPYMAKDSVNPSDYFPATMHDFDCSDGTVYGLPKDFGTLGLVYNKTMFQQAGISDPSNWTWDDVASAAQKLTGTNGPNGKVYGLSAAADPARWMAFLYALGGNVLSADGKKAVFNDALGVQSATWYTSFEKNKTGVKPDDVGAGWNGDAFGKQRVGMTFEGGWMIPFMTSSFPSIQYGIAPMPKAPNGQRGDLLFTNAWGAYSGTKHADAAWKLIQWMTGKTVQTNVLHAGFALPTIQSLVNDPSLDSLPNVKQLLQNASYGHSWFYGQAHTEVVKDTGDALTAIMLGKSDVQSALNDAATKVNNWIAQNET